MGHLTAWGEYAKPNDLHDRERMMFRRAVAEHAPEVMNRIRDEAFPAYKRPVGPGSWSDHENGTACRR